MTSAPGFVHVHAHEARPMIHRINIHGLGLMLAEWVGLGASVEAIVRFLHGPHAMAAANFLAAFAVAAYTHAVRNKAASPPPEGLDVDELVRRLKAELRPVRPRIHEPERPATIPLAGDPAGTHWPGCRCGRHREQADCPICWFWSDPHVQKGTDGLWPDGRQATTRPDDRPILLPSVHHVQGLEGVEYIPPGATVRMRHGHVSVPIAKPDPIPEKPA